MPCATHLAGAAALQNKKPLCYVHAAGSTPRLLATAWLPVAGVAGPAHEREAHCAASYI